MERAKSKILVTLGIVFLVAATLVMGWFAGRFVPADPMPTAEDRMTYRYPNEVTSGSFALENVDVAAGNSLVVDDITQGLRFTYPIQEAKAGAEDGGESFERALQASPYWQVGYGSFSLETSEVKVLSGESFKEWYPNAFIPEDSPLPEYRGSKLPGKAFLVAVKAVNLSSTQSIKLPNLTLWSADFNTKSDSDSMSSRAYPSVFLTSVLYPESAKGENESFASGPGGLSYGLEDNSWLILGPGEEREIVLPFYVYRNSFTSDEAFENVDLSKFCIEVNDYDPGVRYRFWLG